MRDRVIYLGGLVAVPIIFFAARRKLNYSSVDVALALTAVAMIVFLLFGFPHLLAKVTLFSMTNLNRVKAGLGLAAVILLIRHFSRQPPKARGLEAVHLWVALPIIALFTILFVKFLRTSGFITPMRTVVMLASVNLSLLLFIVAGRPVAFFAVMLPFLLMHNFLINPIAKGFKAITEKSLYRSVREIDISDPTAKWVVFGRLEVADFLKFTGADLINGNKFYPVFEYNNILDPQHHYTSIWNCYSHIEFLDDPRCQEATYGKVRPAVYRVNVAATSPALDQIGVRYCVLTYPPPASYLPAVLSHVQDGTKSYWILRRDLIPRLVANSR